MNTSVRNSRKHLVNRQVEVSEDIKGKEGLGRTGHSVQGTSDGLDVLSATSVLRGLELLDKVRTLWTCAVDDIHDDQRWTVGYVRLRAERDWLWSCP